MIRIYMMSCFCRDYVHEYSLHNEDEYICYCTTGWEYTMILSITSQPPAYCKKRFTTPAKSDFQLDILHQCIIAESPNISNFNWRLRVKSYMIGEEVV